MRRLLLVAVLASLAACASQAPIPELIEKPPADPYHLAKWAAAIQGIAEICNIRTDGLDERMRSYSTRHTEAGRIPAPYELYRSTLVLVSDEKRQFRCTAESLYRAQRAWNAVWEASGR